MTKQDDQTGSSPDDPAELARRFVDLWQSQISAMAADPASAKAVQDAMSLWHQAVPGMGAAMSGQPHSPAFDPAAMQGMMQVWAGMLSPRSDFQGASHADGGENGTTAAAGSPDGVERLLHELDRRFTRLEQRLDVLETGVDAGSAGNSKPAKKSRSKKSRSKRPRARKPD